MRCGQCQFENMPGLERCFQCGAVLGEAEPMDVNPPRMTAWQRPLRGLGRWVRSQRSGGGKQTATTVKKARHVDYWEFFKIFSAAALSLIPGLGHLAVGRFGRVWWQVLIWVGFAAMAVFMYGSSFGYLAFGLAVVLHARIAVHWPEEEGLRGFKRLGAMLAMVILAAVMYTGVFHAIADRNLIWVYTPFAVEAKMVRSQDMLLARTRFVTAQIRHGTLVVTNLPVVPQGRGYRRAWSRSNAVAQIVGRAGDTVEVKEDSFFVNNRRLDASQYNFPAFLRGRQMSVLVPEGQVFVGAEYSVVRRGQFDTAQLLQVCVIPEGDITGIVFMRWLPLLRRGFITEQ